MNQSFGRFLSRKNQLSCLHSFLSHSQQNLTLCLTVAILFPLPILFGIFSYFSGKVSSIISSVIKKSFLSQQDTHPLLMHLFTVQGPCSRRLIQSTTSFLDSCFWNLIICFLYLINLYRSYPLSTTNYFFLYNNCILP